MYILARMLTDAEAERRVYRPEGAEDLAIYATDQRPIEAIQVKDHSSPLALSDFKPSSPTGYFARMLHRQRQEPQCITKIATFSGIGPELIGAINGHAPHREAIIGKLSRANSNISHQDAARMLDALHDTIEYPVETELRVNILSALKGTIGGGHAESAIELLLFWVFDASERRRDLTRSMILLQLQRIGAYLAALRDSSAEWMAGVRPVETADLSVEERDRLRREYRQGVQANWRHILADADYRRADRLADIHKAMQRHSAVVIRGASGQGKSSLGWRYLHDYCAEGLRFQVRLVESRDHALRVANALLSHIRKLQLNAVVYVDVSPSDSGWAELLRELAQAGLRVLVTVREEDFLRGGVVAGDVDIEEISLDNLSRAEAKEIFAALTVDEIGEHTLDFEEAWLRFSATEGGPLLEFTHLVTQGGTLAARLEAQIRRIQEEAGSGRGPITNAHIRLLALATVANAEECRVDFDQLCKFVGLDPLTRPLTYFENEYLIRVQRGGERSTVAPLHPLRSRAMLRALLHDTPETWDRLASQCLPLVIDIDVERFLLCAFSRHPNDTASLETTLRHQPLRSWTQAGAICRALLWRGVDRYERENRHTLSGAVKKYDTGWWFVCDSFIAGGTSAKIRDALSELTKDFELVTLTPKERVYGPFESWAAVVLPPNAPPSRPPDWLGVGDLAFWIGKRAVEGPLRSSIKSMLPSMFPPYLTLNEIAAFISGRYAIGDHPFDSWHEQQKSELTRRFLRETHSMYLNDDGNEVKVYFPAVMSQAPDDGSKGHDWRGDAMKRIRLLRELFPKRQIYGSQGLGLEALGDLMPHDQTKHRIPEENLPPIRSVQLNALFGNLVAYRHKRALSWKTYAESILILREAICAAFHQLHRAWGRMLSERTVQARTIKQMPVRELDRIQELSKIPMLPRNVVDEWGFVSEGRERPNDFASGSERLWTGLRRFKDWAKTFGDFESGVSQVVRRSIEQTGTFLSARRSGDSEAIYRNGHLLLANLNTALMELRPMQEQFRRLFAHLFDPQRVSNLEQHERSTFQHFWAVAFAFARKPLCRVTGGHATLEKSIDQRRTHFLRELEEQVSHALDPSDTVRVSDRSLSIEGEPCLLVVCDHREFAAIHASRRSVVKAIWQAARAGHWQSLEWAPLVVEWPKLLVVHTFRGRAVLAAGTKLWTSVIFGSESEFEPAAHHIMELPIALDDFASTGISTWDLPLVRSAVRWEGALFAFAISGMRVSPMLEVAVEHAIPDETLSDSFASFSRELTALRVSARESYEDLIAILRAAAENCDPTNTHPSDWLQSAHVASEKCLFSVADDANTFIDLRLFTIWMTELPATLAEIARIVPALIVYAVEETQP